MATIDILQDIVRTLQDSGHFACVTLGTSPADAAVPRATVMFDSQDAFPRDDEPDGQWVRVKATVAIRTRSEAPSGAIKRALELYDLAAQALLESPDRGGLCQHLPPGRATEIGSPEFSASIRFPEVELLMPVSCHFETQES